jgi:hypothetical protein
MTFGAFFVAMAVVVNAPWNSILVRFFVGGAGAAILTDELAWLAKFTGDDASGRLRGKRIDDLEWDIPKQNSVKGLARCGEGQPWQTVRSICFNRALRSQAYSAQESSSVQGRVRVGNYPT